MIFVLKSRDGILDAGDQHVLKELGDAIEAGKGSLLLHIHGGLVKQANGEAIAARLGGAAPDGFGLGAPWQQAFVVWRTDALETIATNWTDLFQNDRLYQTLLRRLVEFAGRKLELPGGGGRSAGAAAGLTPDEVARRLKNRPPGDPFADIHELIKQTAEGRGVAIASSESAVSLVREFQQELSFDGQFNRAATDIGGAAQVSAKGRAFSEGLGADISNGNAMLARLKASVRGELDEKAHADTSGRGVSASITFELLKHAGAIIFRIIDRFRKGRDHGFYATIVEELARELYGDLLGAAIWGMMKKDAADHFGPQGLGTALLAAIPNNTRLVVTAHSAGAIWAAELIKAAAAANRTLHFDLVLMAPAVRMDLFSEALKAGGSLVDRCRIFTMRDELERSDAVLGHDKGYIYPSSLLYLVSGLFEEIGAAPFPDAALLGLQRFLSGNVPWLKDPDQAQAIAEVVQFFTAPGHDIVYGTTDPTAPPGRRTLSTSHGDFDTEVETVASVATFFQ